MHLQATHLYMRAVQKVSYLVVQTRKILTCRSETLIALKLLCLRLHTRFPAFFPLLKAQLEDLIGNGVQLGGRVLNNVIS